MDSISGWAMAISISAVVCTIVEMLVSDSKLEKTVRFVLGAFMLCAILMPIGEMITEISEIDFNNQISADSGEEFNEQKLKLMKSNIVSLVEDTLAEKEIYPNKTEIDMDIDENNSISMVSVTVVLEKKDAEKADIASSIVKSQLGLECNTVFAD